MGTSRSLGNVEVCFRRSCAPSYTPRCVAVPAPWIRPKRARRVYTHHHHADPVEGTSGESGEGESGDGGSTEANPVSSPPRWRFCAVVYSSDWAELWGSSSHFPQKRPIKRPSQ